MNNLNLAVVISAVDQASKVLGNVKASIGKVGESADNLGQRFDHAVKRVGTAAGNIGNSLQSLGTKAMMFITLPILAAGGALSKFAMEAVESENLFEVSMGKMADDARAWSETLRAELGLNAYEVRRNVGTLNVMLGSMGVAEEAAYGMAKSLTQLTYDLSSFYNLSTDEAFTKIQSGLSGEVEPLKRLGIVINETTVKAWALKQGWIEQGQEMSETQKVIARYGTLLEQTSKAQGDLARTMDSPANMLRRLQSEVMQLATDIGMELLPVVSAGFTWIANEGLPAVRRGLANVQEWWGSMSERAQWGLLTIAALLVAGGPLLKGLGLAYNAIIMLGSAFQFATFKALGLLAAAAAVGAAAEASMYAVTTGGDWGDRFKANLAIYGAELERHTATLAEQMGMEKGLADRMARRVDIMQEMQQAQGYLADAERRARQAQEFGGGWAQQALEDAKRHKARLADLETELEQLGVSFGVSLAGGIAEGAAEGVGDVARWVAEQMKLIESDPVRQAQREMERAAGLSPKVPYQVETEGAKDYAASLEELLKAFRLAAGGADDTSKAAGKLRDALLNAAGGASNLVSYLVSIHPAAQASAARVAELRNQLAGLEAAQQANQRAARAAQDALRGMQEHASNLSKALSDAKQKLQDLANVRLPGMGEADSQIEALQKHIGRLKLAELSGVSIEEIMGEFPILAAGMEQWISGLEGSGSREAMEKLLEILRETKGLRFDEQLRMLKEAANPLPAEMPFEQALAAIKATKIEIGNLEGQLAGAEAAVRAQEAAIRALDEASYQISQSIQTLRTQLTLEEERHKAVTEALKVAYEWYIKDREKIMELGGEAVTQAQIIDAETSRLLLDISSLAQDEAAAAIGAINAMVATYEDARRRISGVDVPSVPEYRHSGGPVYAGHPYIVRPDEELFIPSQSGTVLPVTGGAGSVSVSVYVSGSVVSERDLVDAVHAGLTKKRRDNGGRLFE